MSITKARIYREAGRRIEQREEIYSCNAIDRITNKSDLVAEYKELFELGEGDSQNANTWDLWAEVEEEERTNRRVLMLCLASAIEFGGGF